MKIKYSTVKNFIKGYRKSVSSRGAIIDRHALRASVKGFKLLLEKNGLLGKY